METGPKNNTIETIQILGQCQWNKRKAHYPQTISNILYVNLLYFALSPLWMTGSARMNKVNAIQCNTTKYNTTRHDTTQYNGPRITVTTRTRARTDSYWQYLYRCSVFITSVFRLMQASSKEKCEQWNVLCRIRGKWNGRIW